VITTPAGVSGPVAICQACSDSVVARVNVAIDAREVRRALPAHRPVRRVLRRAVPLAAAAGLGAVLWWSPGMRPGTQGPPAVAPADPEMLRHKGGDGGLAAAHPGPELALALVREQGGAVTPLADGVAVAREGMLVPQLRLPGDAPAFVYLFARLPGGTTLTLVPAEGEHPPRVRGEFIPAQGESALGLTLAELPAGRVDLIAVTSTNEVPVARARAVAADEGAPAGAAVSRTARSVELR
jgi:hypothetical protein